MSITVNRILEGFQVFLDALIEQELLIDSNSLVVTHVSNRTEIAWARNPSLSYLFGDYSSIEQYVETLKRRDFCLCFRDGGLIQISYRIEADDITFHRLCYVPCPFKYDAADWQGISLSDVPSMMSERDLICNSQLASPLRFDFDAGFSDEKHAHSHLSINKQSCRIPAYGPISLGHFFRFVIRYFYEIQFDVGLCWDEPRPVIFSRTLGHPRPHELHIESSIGY